MKAPKIWLQKFVDLSDISDQVFADKMTFAGNKVETVHKINGKTVYEFEITSNRPDTLSIIGLAREASAIFNKKLTLSENPAIKSLANPPIRINIANKKLCPAYSAVEIDNVTIKPSSHTIQSLLKLAGHRPVNNIVDITNYLMWQTNQPMHAFDADKIKGQLTLRAAKPKETITPLDHKQRVLNGGEIIIEDKEKLVDLAGLMGGLNTEISESTKKVYLLVPVYDPIAIRRASQHLKLRSDASTRFEKKIDLTITKSVAQQVIQLISQESIGQPSSQLVTVQSSWQPPTIKFSLAKLNSWLGYQFTQTQVDQYLNSVGIKKTSSGYQTPAWRRDIQTPVDLFEEVARLYGYNQLPKTLPTGTIPVHQTALKPNWLRLIKNQLAALGYSETYSSTLISHSTIIDLNINPQTHLKVLHPMSIDYEYMRTTILESLLPLVDQNLKHSKKINLFELGTVFHQPKPANKLPHQPLELGTVSTTVTYPQLKGQLYHLAHTLNLDLQIKPAKNPHPALHPSNQAQIYLDHKAIGVIGQTKDKKAWTLTLNISVLINHASPDYQYPPLSNFPPIIEDFTFTLPPQTYLGPVIKAIKNTHQLVHQVQLTKTYQNNYTFNLTYQSLHQPLTDKSLAPIRKKIVANLSKKFKAKLVGQL